MTASVDMIGRVVSDIRCGRVVAISPDVRVKALTDTAITTPVVNATAVYHSICEGGGPIDIYEDHPCIAPPWDAGVICYLNDHGNVHAMTLSVSDRQRGDPIVEWETMNPVRWNEVRWVVGVAVYIGGMSYTLNCHVPTTGPLLVYAWAVYESGEPADIHWIDVTGLNDEVEDYNNCMLTVLATLNFMNCRNVSLIDQATTLHRAEARRLARTGVQINVLNVYPAGVTRRGDKRDEPLGVPLTSVRGHFASYGERYGRKMLFGKYEGRFWIPMHARGSRDHGENVNDYDLKAQ